MSQIVSKRKFLRNIAALIGLAVAPQAMALNILESIENQVPNAFQADLIKNPYKQQLIAEIAPCVGLYFPDPMKAKCQAANG